MTIYWSSTPIICSYKIIRFVFFVLIVFVIFVDVELPFVFAIVAITFINSSHSVTEVSSILFKYLLFSLIYMLWRGHKGSSFCCTPTKKLQNLWSAISKKKVLRLRHYQDSQIAIYIDPKLSTSILINQKTLFLEKH